MSEVKIDVVYETLVELGPSTNRAVVTKIDDPDYAVHAVSKALEALVKHGCAKELGRQAGKIVYRATDFTPEEYRSQVRAGSIQEETGESD